MKKKNKEEAVAVLAKAEVNNNINLTLNSNDVVDLLVEETREKLIARYRELREEMRAYFYKYIDSDEVKKLIISRLLDNPFIRLGLKKYENKFTVKSGEWLSEESDTLRVYDDDELDTEEYLKKNEVYCRGRETVNTNPLYTSRLEKPMLRIDFDDDSTKKGTGVAVFVNCDEALLEGINKELTRLNAHKAKIVEEMEQIMKSLRGLNNKRAKAKLVRSVLNNSPEGREVLATVSSIAIAPKQLKS